MKIQVRKGVFETNSSSTHSLQLAKQTVDEAKNVVSERIKELYEYDAEPMFDESMYIDDDKLILKGFPITSSEETTCVYYIITNWVAKIQYLAMLLKEYTSNIDGFEEEAAKYKDMNSWCYQEQESILQKLNVYKKFVELIKEYSKKKGLVIKDVVFEMEESTWVEFFTFKDKNFLNEKITVNYLEDLFNTVMDDSYIITYSDEAYYPYATPSIYIF